MENNEPMYALPRYLWLLSQASFLDRIPYICYNFLKFYSNYMTSSYCVSERRPSYLNLFAELLSSVTMSNFFGQDCANSQDVL